MTASRRILWPAIFVLAVTVDAAILTRGRVILGWVFGRHGRFDSAAPGRPAPPIEQRVRERVFGVAAGSDGALYLRTEKALRARDASGAERWSHPTTVSDAPYPFVAPDGTVLAADRDGLTALTPDGGVKWHLEPRQLRGPTGDERINEIAIATDGTIYAAGWTLRAITADGRVAWTFGVPIGMVTSVAVAPDGTVLAGGMDLHALRPDGTVKWKVERAWAGGFAIAPDGTVYWVYNFYPDRDRRLMAVGPDGVKKWELRLERDGRRPAIGPDGTIYVAAGPLYAVAPTGQVRWMFRPTTELEAPVVLAANGRIYTGRAVELFAVDARGALAWTARAPTDFAELKFFLAPDPAAPLYAINGAELFEVRDDPRGPLTAPWPQPGRDPGHTGSAQVPR